MGKSTISMAMFNSYVKFPEGSSNSKTQFIMLIGMEITRKSYEIARFESSNIEVAHSSDFKFQVRFCGSKAVSIGSVLSWSCFSLGMYCHC